MTKIAYIADVHLGNHKKLGGKMEAGINTRCEQTAEALHDAASLAQFRGCSILVIAGDLFDDTRPLPQVIKRAQDALQAFSGEVVILTGNHDSTSTELGDHALGPLYKQATIIEMPTVYDVGGHQYLYLLPFQPGKVSKWLPKQIEELSTNPKHKCIGLVGHFGVSFDDTPRFMQGSDDSIDYLSLQALMANKIPAAFLGHWHGYAGLSTRDIFQIGALAPTGWDNPGDDGLYGKVIVQDTGVGTIEVLEVGGPRFFKGMHTLTGKYPYVSLSVLAKDVQKAQVLLEQAKKSGKVFAGEILISGASAEDNTEHARKAVQAVRSEVTMKEALVDFIDGLGLPEGQRQEVLTLSESYLVKAGG